MTVIAFPRTAPAAPGGDAASDAGVLLARVAEVEQELLTTVGELERLQELARTTLTAETPTVGPWVLNASQGELAGPGGIRVRVTPSEVKLLDLLLRAQGHVVRRRAMLQVLGYRLASQERNMDSLVKRLRDKLSDCGVIGDTIETVFGFGYRWKAGASCQ